jgi:signal transduction histidine kinase
VRLAEAESELRSALGELRELAHGIFPAVLADEGLAAAVEALAEDSRIPIRIEALPDDRLDPAVEAAAYFVVAETVKHTGAGEIVVDVACRSGRLVVDLSGELARESRVDLEDRVGALDGRLAVTRDASGHATLRAEIPCAS